MAKLGRPVSQFDTFQYLLRQMVDEVNLLADSGSLKI